MRFSARAALKLLEDGKFDKAIALAERFRGRHYFADYVLGQARSRRGLDGEGLDGSDLQEIITLYSSSIALKSDYPDVYLMRGLAYLQASVLDTNPNSAIVRLGKVEKDMRRCLELDERFRESVEGTLKTVRRRIEELSAG